MDVSMEEKGLNDESQDELEEQMDEHELNELGDNLEAEEEAEEEVVEESNEELEEGNVSEDLGDGDELLNDNELDEKEIQGIKDKVDDILSPKTGGRSKEKMWECPACQRSMHRNSKQRHLRNSPRCQAKGPAGEIKTEIKTEIKSITSINEEDKERKDVEENVEEKIDNEIKMLENEIEEEPTKMAADLNPYEKDEIKNEESDKKVADKLDDEIEKLKKDLEEKPTNTAAAAAAELSPYEKDVEGKVECDVCNVRIMMCSLSKHMRRKHKDHFRCNVCDTNFNKKNGLSMHMKKSHKITPDKNNVQSIV